jgi:hypothetical protein
VRHHRSARIWAGRVAAMIVILGLVAYLAAVGLDKADKLASVLGLLVAVTALVAPYLLPMADESATGPQAAQSVANTVVGGHLTQARGTKDVRVQSVTTAMPQPISPSRADQAPKIRGGQYVDGVWVGGNLTQVDGPDGAVNGG